MVRESENSTLLQAALMAKLKTTDTARSDAEAQNESLTNNQAAFLQKLKGSESKCETLQSENVELKEQASPSTATAQ